MAYKVLITSRAKDNVRQAFTYYEQLQKGLGKRFVSEVKRIRKHIVQFPYASFIRYQDTIIVP